MDKAKPRAKRVFVSVPRDHNLLEAQRTFKHAILKIYATQASSLKNFRCPDYHCGRLIPLMP
ncbi:hypothetical protein SAMN05216420_11076 [Nitrosospira sp. Nl5]|nr:hypothetical protein SAMN05216420_11076 [Nitrosospira sp. Nl5]